MLIGMLLKGFGFGEKAEIDVPRESGGKLIEKLITDNPQYEVVYSKLISDY